MKFEFYSKSLEYEPDLTKVTLTTAEGGNVPIYLPADLINLSNQELFEKALDKIYEINFPMRAENEKFNTMGEKIAQFDDMMDKMKLAIEESNKATEEDRNVMKTVSLTLNEVLAMVYSSDDEEASDDEHEATVEEIK